MNKVYLDSRLNLPREIVDSLQYYQIDKDYFINNITVEYTDDTRRFISFTIDGFTELYDDNIIFTEESSKITIHFIESSLKREISTIVNNTKRDLDILKRLEKEVYEFNIPIIEIKLKRKESVSISDFFTNDEDLNNYERIMIDSFKAYYDSRYNFDRRIDKELKSH